ncbi:hypothetical protein V6N11_041441 [Hibiscus sabdariffa]|uniref:CDT1 Geminin-binding domain-containing protein n=1 Tax=Hibiscus sabdariffa TaxID=183260 RepID=A0ABR2RKV7_9ROSI
MDSSNSLQFTPLKSRKSPNLTSNSPVSKTPVKHASRLPTRAESPPLKISGVGPDKLPEKYETLCGFFVSLDSAIRLLKLKGSMPTFTNICPKVECLTDRRFSHGHLAQLKHILPEAIEIKRILIFDERTSCMKPDLQVRIIADAIDCGDRSESETKNLNLRVFRARLVDYFKAHPEGGEIPEEDLPEPFNRSKQNTQWDMIGGLFSLSSDESSTDTLTEQQSLTSRGEVLKLEPQPSDQMICSSKLAVETLAISVDDRLPVVASHVSRTFRKCFSRKTTSKAQEVVEKCSKVSLWSSNFQVAELCTGKSVDNDKSISAPTQTPTEFLSKPTVSELSSKPCLPATPVKEINPLETEDKPPTKSGCNQSTPAKLASTPARLMIGTPTLKPQKRCYMSPDEVSSGSLKKLVRRPPRTRSLNFEDDDDLSILSESLLHSTREKERKAIEEQDPAVWQEKRRQRMIACLPKLFNMIHYLFQSIKRSVITKEELVHKIIAGHCDISDRGEVEEQLKLLLELAPDWISEKMASAGDLLVCINKMSSPKSIRMQLQEAK